MRLRRSDGRGATLAAELGGGRCGVVRDGFDDGSDDVLLLAVGEQKVETGGKAVGVRDGGEEVEGAIDGFEAQGSGGALGEGVGEAGKEAGVAEVLAQADGDVVGADELDGEVDREPRQPIKEGANRRHGGRTATSSATVYRAKGEQSTTSVGGRSGFREAANGEAACYDHDRRQAETLHPAEGSLAFPGLGEVSSAEDGAPNGEVRTKPGGRVLVVEDDQPLSRFLCRTLRTEKYEAELAHDGQTALEMLQPTTDLLILDINLPGMDGFSVLRALRPRFPKLPVLVLTARSRTEDTVAAFDSGADDCLVKPFSYHELLARVRALLRRNTGVLPRSTQVGDLVLYREEHRVERNGRKVELTPREFALLEFLMREPGTPVSRAVLMQEVWGVAFDPTTNVVDVYLKYIRDKVDRDGEVKLIRTVRGVGYVVGEE